LMKPLNHEYTQAKNSAAVIGNWEAVLTAAKRARGEAFDKWDDFEKKYGYDHKELDANWTKSRDIGIGANKRIAESKFADAKKAVEDATKVLERADQTDKQSWKVALEAYKRIAKAKAKPVRKCTKGRALWNETEDLVKALCAGASLEEAKAEAKFNAAERAFNAARLDYDILRSPSTCSTDEQLWETALKAAEAVHATCDTLFAENGGARREALVGKAKVLVGYVKHDREMLKFNKGWQFRQKVDEFIEKVKKAPKRRVSSADPLVNVRSPRRSSAPAGARRRLPHHRRLVVLERLLEEIREANRRHELSKK